MANYPQATQDTVDLVWAVMQRDHTGYENRIERSDLVLKMSGTINDESNDRKLRDALSQLPVVWDDGYFIPNSKEEAAPYLRGNRSRIANLGKKNWIVERYLRRRANPVKVEQMKLEV